MKGVSDIIGLIPAAGSASRLAPLPCSKELYPIGFRNIDGNDNKSPKVVSQYLLEKMQLAGIEKVYMIIRDGKWDIPSYFGDGNTMGVSIGYLMMDLPFGVPFTLDQAYPFVQNAVIALGFPDILFQPEDAYISIIAKLHESNADIVLGLFPAEKPWKTDMVVIGTDGRVKELQIKPEKTSLTYTWQIAVWKPEFTDYMHRYVVTQSRTAIRSQMKKEFFVGDVIQAALEDKMNVESVLFSEGTCLDIGTPDDLVRSLQMMNPISNDSANPH